MEPEPLLYEHLLLKDDHCHGSVPPIIVRVWYEPIEDEI